MTFATTSTPDFEVVRGWPWSWPYGFVTFHCHGYWGVKFHRLKHKKLDGVMRLIGLLYTFVAIDRRYAPITWFQGHDLQLPRIGDTLHRSTGFKVVKARGFYSFPLSLRLFKRTESWCSENFVFKYLSSEFDVKIFS